MSTINPTLPTVGGDDGTWGAKTNAAFTAIITQANANDGRIATLEGKSTVSPTDLVTALGAVVGTNLQSASYTLVLADAGKAVEMSVSSANTVTVPTNASVAFPIGTVVEITQVGTSSTTIAAASGVTLRNPAAGLRIQAQWGTASLRKRGADEWVVAGYVGA